MAAEDDYFGDDDGLFDNPDELQELENAVVLASLTQKQQQLAPPKPVPQATKNPYQIVSKAAAASNRASNQTASARTYGRPTNQTSVPKPTVPTLQPQTTTLSKEEQDVRTVYLQRNQERQRMRKQQQEEYLAQQRQQENASSQQRAAVVEPHQSQQSQAYSHRQRQLQPRTSIRHPTPSYITQPTLISTDAERAKLQVGKNAAGQAGTVSRTDHAGGTRRTANGSTTRPFHTAKTHPPGQNAATARPEEYERYNESEELWNTAAPTEMVMQETAGVSALGTSAFGTSAWIPTDVGTTALREEYGTVADATKPLEVTNHDMVDYDVEAEKHILDDEVIMDVDEASKGLAAEQLEELENLRKMTQMLLAQKDELEKKFKEAKSEAQTKLGENTILRTKMERAKVEHERELASFKAQSKKALEDDQNVISALRLEVNSLNNDREFEKSDRRELLEELKHAKQAPKVQQLVTREPNPRANVNPVTPRKSRVSHFRDGFDDQEVGMGMRSSPPVGMPGRSGRATPSKSGKRKRKPGESPMKASQTLMLSISHSNNNSQRSMMLDMAPDSEEEDYDAMIDRLTLDDLGIDCDGRQEFLENLLSIKRFPDTSILQILNELTYPSDSSTSLGALFMEHITPLEASAAYGEFPAEVCNVLISLWDRCYTEKFFMPLELILRYLNFIMTQDFGAHLFPLIMEPFAEVLQKTVMLNSLERFKGRTDRVRMDIDVDECLILFELVALGVLADEDVAKHFWTLIHPDFIAPFMSYNQPMSQIRLILSALPASVFTTSFGPIATNEHEQKDFERVALIHASFLLTTEPKPDPDLDHVPGVRRAVLLDIRSRILAFYTAIAATDHGIESFVTNSNWQGLSRVIVRIHHELEECYEDRYGLQNSVKFVNDGVRFIHRVIKLQKSNDDIDRLLSSATGGNGNKHLVTFARLAFAKEKGYLNDVGVGSETVEMAMEVLEGSVTMEQGDELWGLFRGRPGGYGGEVSMTESIIEAEKILREEEMR